MESVVWPRQNILLFGSIFECFKLCCFKIFWLLGFDYISKPQNCCFYTLNVLNKHNKKNRNCVQIYNFTMQLLA